MLYFFLLQLSSALPVAAPPMLGGWKSSTMVYGVRCAMMGSIPMLLMLYVDTLVTSKYVLGTVTHLSRLVGKPTMWFPNRSDTNRAVQAQSMARDWKFWIEKVEELYYPLSENKGADQLRSYCEADLRLCFRICRLLVFS